MALVKCPECGRDNVSDSAKACPNCGYNIRGYYSNITQMNNSTSENEGVNYLDDASVNNSDDASVNNSDDGSYTQNSKDRNITYVVIGLIVLFVLFLWYASTRCEVEGCYKRALSSSRYCSLHKYLYDSKKTTSSYSSNDYDYNYNKKSKYDLSISNVEVHKTSSTMYCTGTIKNDGDESFSFVKVKASFKDDNGNTIETGDSYAVGSEGLAPGEATTFTIYGTKNSDVTRCDVSVYDYD